MKIYILSIFIVMNAAGTSFSLNISPVSDSDNIIRSFLTSIFRDNKDHVENISHKHFKSFSEHQTPRATVLSCSDSRVQADAFHKDPVNDLFWIRNIGNQMKPTEGSIEYGVNNLHTPILMIVGHTNCGAVHAALGDYSKEAQSVRKELDNLHLTHGINPNSAVIENVDNQVAFALNKYKNKIANKSLVVLGLIYDFRDDLKKGRGRLILVNLNGEKDPSSIRKSIYLKDLNGADHLVVLPNN
ncbi:MAG: carbonic anhydrase [Myxococcales bacterium]|nr:carbonic anhydrase [Myxococcales bacterium]USN51022.1 MAG: carbonic anhydrase [Myxococcales bacterium]